MRKRTLFAFLAIVLIGSCASTSGYRYYVLDPVNDKLLGATPADDLPLQPTCTPDAVSKAKCIAMLSEEYFKLVKELLDDRQALKDGSNCPK